MLHEPATGRPRRRHFLGTLLGHKQQGRTSTSHFCTATRKPTAEVGACRGQGQAGKHQPTAAPTQVVCAEPDSRLPRCPCINLVPLAAISSGGDSSGPPCAPPAAGSPWPLSTPAARQDGAAGRCAFPHLLGLIREAARGAPCGHLPGSPHPQTAQPANLQTPAGTALTPSQPPSRPHPAPARRGCGPGSTGSGTAAAWSGRPPGAAPWPAGAPPGGWAQVGGKMVERTGMQHRKERPIIGRLVSSSRCLTRRSSVPANHAIPQPAPHLVVHTGCLAQQISRALLESSGKIAATTQG